MQGWSSWWWGGAVVLALGCGGQLGSPTEPGAAITPDGSPGAGSGSRPLTPVPVDAVGIALGADDSGVYWTTPANDLWALRAGSEIPERLATEPGSATSCPGTSKPVLAGPNVFWYGMGSFALHRTPKDGSGDEMLSTLIVPRSLAVDADDVYWTEVWGEGRVGGGVIRALPQTAAVGDAPRTLVNAGATDAIASIAVQDGTLYWAAFGPYAPTSPMFVYYATLWSAPLATLSNGTAGTSSSSPPSPYELTTSGGSVYVAYKPLPPGETGLVSLSPKGDPATTISTMSVEAFGLGVVDEWIFASTGDAGICNPDLSLYAAPLAGGKARLIVEGMRTAAIATGDGIIFVDGERRLMKLSTADLRARLAATL